MNISTPKFEIGQQVLVFENGTFQKRIIEKCIIKTDEKRCTISYRFKAFGSWLDFGDHFGTPEKEIFLNKEELIKIVEASDF